MEESLILNKEIERVGFGKRLGSSLLDFIISLLPGIVLGIYAGATIAAFLLDFFTMKHNLKPFKLDFQEK